MLGERGERLRVGVAYKDRQGRYADFHALRYTWATLTPKHGIADSFATRRKILRAWA
jgi:hypothetical protein